MQYKNTIWYINKNIYANKPVIWHYCKKCFETIDILYGTKYREGKGKWHCSICKEKLPSELITYLKLCLLKDKIK